MTVQRRFLAGLSAYVRGDPQTAAWHCRRALTDHTLSDTLRVRLIHLYLLATELWWSLDPTDDVSRLTDQAVAAAARAEDPALAAFAHCMRGRYLLATHSLPDAVAAFSGAADAAAQSGNLLAQVETLADLGHHMAGLNLSRGLALLRQGWALAERPGDDQTPSCDRPLLPVSRARLAGLMGVALFDDGRFGEAAAWLRRSRDELRMCRAWDVFASISNYLAQLLTETGSFEEAESVLREALEHLRADADLSTHQGYNLGLLGKLYLEWGRIGDAEASITAGWSRLQGTRHIAVLPILRNYLGELLMHPGYPRRDLYRARALFDETIQECQRSGFQRSEIAALAFRGLACLALGELDGAAAASAQAVSKLESAGTMPALRTEEIYLARYQVLSASGHGAAAARSLACANHALQEKAASLDEPRLRQQFLTRVPTSARIVCASQSLPGPAQDKP